jgi:hypothetical protein
LRTKDVRNCGISKLQLIRMKHKIISGNELKLSAKTKSKLTFLVGEKKQ